MFEVILTHNTERKNMVKVKRLAVKNGNIINAVGEDDLIYSAFDSVNKYFDELYRIQNVEKELMELEKVCKNEQLVNKARILEAERLIINYLAAFRRYLAACDKKLKDDPFYKNITANEFDNNINYAFTYALRNHTEHVDKIEVKKMIICNNQEIKIIVDKQKLLESDDKWHKAAIKFFEQSEEKIDLFFVLKSAFSSLQTINNKLLDHRITDEVYWSMALVWDTFESFCEDNEIIVSVDENGNEDVDSDDHIIINKGDAVICELLINRKNNIKFGKKNKV
jgi:hypothetical protein